MADLQAYLGRCAARRAPPEGSVSCTDAARRSTDERQEGAQEQERGPDRDSISRQVRVAEQLKLRAQPRIQEQGTEQQRKSDESHSEKAHDRLPFRCLSLE